MIQLNLWKYQNAIKTLYSKCMGSVCTEHGLTRMELDIILFLANNPRFDTATDMVEIRYFSKSQVSTSVKLLEKRGYIRKKYDKDNRKTVHLKICEEAHDVIEDGRRAQEKFFAVMAQGFTQDEIECMERNFKRIMGNIDGYVKEKAE